MTFISVKDKDADHIFSANRFLPRDATLARYTLSSCVCLSNRHKSQFYQNG